MKLNLMILGLVLVFGGCEGEGVNPVGPTRGVATRTTTDTVTLTATDGTTSTTTETATETVTVVDTDTGTVTGTTNATNTKTNTLVAGATITATYTYYSAGRLATQTGTYTVVAPAGSTFTWIGTETATNTTINTSTLAVTDVRPVPGMSNPCNNRNACSDASIGAFSSCGWNGDDNKCYYTMWCGPSVLSVGQNYAQGSLFGNGTVPLLSQRPASAKCGTGQATFTYNPGELLMWQPNSYDARWNYSGAGGYKDGNVCAPNVQVVTINC